MEDLLNGLYQASRVIEEAFGYFAEETAARKKAERNRTLGENKYKYMFLLIIPITIAISTVMSIFISPIGANSSEGVQRFLISLVLLIPLPSAAVIYFILIRPIINGKKKAVQKTYQEGIRQADELHAKAISVLQDNVDKLAFIPEEYRYPLAVSYLIKYLQEGRAQTLQDALDRFDEQQHRWKMESAQQQMLQLQQQQSNQLNAIRRDINWNTAVSSIGAAANILGRL